MTLNQGLVGEEHCQIKELTDRAGTDDPTLGKSCSVGLFRTGQ